MNFTDMLTSIAQISDADNPTIFPFPFWLHISLAVISVIFFAYRFAVQKRPFQLFFAIAVPLSLLVWVSNNRTLFYALGIAEFILIAVAAVTSIVCKPKKTEETAAVTAKAGEDKDSKEE